MAEQSYLDWIRSYLPAPIKEYKKENMAQSAVEWIYEIMFVKNGVITFEEYHKAIDMEKQQHGETWDAAIHAHDERGHVHARSLVDFDDYYEEQFKK